MSTIHPNYLQCDAGKVLGIGSECPCRLPIPVEGTMCVWVPPTTGEMLSASLIRNSILHEYVYSEQKELWEPPSPGMYQMRIPVAGSNSQPAEMQHALLYSGEVVPSLTLAIIGLACMVATNSYSDLSFDNFVRTASRPNASTAVAVGVHCGKIASRLADDAEAESTIWLAAATKFESRLPQQAVITDWVP